MTAFSAPTTQVRKYRSGARLTVDELAARCAEAGAPHLTGPVLYDIESGRKDKATGRRRRTIGIDELLVLAHVLKVKPISLVVPPDIADDEPYEVTPSFATTAGAARRWLRGEGPLDEWAATGPSGTQMMGNDSTDVAALLQRVLKENPEQLAALTALLSQAIDQQKVASGA